MKILMILESEFPPDVRVENEILALTDAGHEVHLACTTRKNRPESERFGKAFVHRKKISEFIYKSSVGCLKFPFYFNFWRNFLFTICSAEGFDAVHINDLPLSEIGREIKEKFNTRLIIDLHENWPALLKTAAHTHTIAGRLLSSNRQWVEYEKRMLPAADKVITVIEEARERVINLGIDPKKICIVSNTINYDSLDIKSVMKDQEVFTIFYGGAINRHRGLQIVLEAVQNFIRKGKKIRFWIVGDGSYRKTLEKLSKSLKIEPYVKFWGHKPFLEMLDILAESDAAIIPHIRNDNNDASSPNKLYQYMYLNKPIISSDCTSLKRIINQTHTGFIYKNDSADELCLLLERLSGERNIIDELNGNGRKAVIEKYNWNVDKGRLLDAYRDLLPYS
jgi:glycosyltransferase involved in cell wall biosynthesis